MPWKEADTVSLREEFVMLGSSEGANISAVCGRFGISRATGYKWLRRYKGEGRSGLADRSRRPRKSPNRTAAGTEQAVLAVRAAHPAWGGRKIQQVLKRRGRGDVPAPSTITQILRRHGRIDRVDAGGSRAWQRFEADAANDLWQMDFKGHFATDGGRCHPLTVLDDHSRFSLGIDACADERTETVKGHLTAIFGRYGLPRRMLMDNGSPWGADAAHPYTPLTVWLLRLGVGVTHSRPLHPQTLGKDERFHRTLKAEVLKGRHWRDLGECQGQFDRWRGVYNLERPHEALGGAVPGEHYELSRRAYPAHLDPIEYAPGDVVRKVQAGGQIHYRGRTYRIGKAFRGYPVALRATATDGNLTVYFCRHAISILDLRHEPRGD